MRLLIRFTKENNFLLTKNQKKNDWILLATKLIKTYLILIMLNNVINYF